MLNDGSMKTAENDETYAAFTAIETFDCKNTTHAGQLPMPGKKIEP